MESKPWLSRYDKGVPGTLLPYPERTLLDYVTDGARQKPDHAALFFKGARITYAELERLSDAFGAALRGLGVRKGDPEWRDAVDISLLEMMTTGEYRKLLDKWFGRVRGEFLDLALRTEIKAK